MPFPPTAASIETYGFLRNVNRGLNNIHSEETRIIRPTQGTVDPFQNSVEAQQYVDKKNHTLAALYVDGNVQNNRHIVRPSLSTRFRLAMVPNPGNQWAEILRNVPNVLFDRKTDAYPAENRTWEFRDQFGHSGGAPLQGPSYVWPEFNYYGNPWGMGGQLYSHLRQGGQQNDGYLWPAKNNTNQKRVRFADQ